MKTAGMNRLRRRLSLLGVMLLLLQSASGCICFSIQEYQAQCCSACGTLCTQTCLPLCIDTAFGRGPLNSAEVALPLSVEDEVPAMSVEPVDESPVPY